MITDRVQRFLDDLVANHNRRFDGHPELRLDRSWPSVGSAELLLTPVQLWTRNHPQLNLDHYVIIDQVAAYIGAIAHDCWSYCDPDATTTLDFASDSTHEIVIRTAGGKFLGSGETFEVAISQRLRDLLTGSQDPVPAFDHYSVPRRDERWLTPVMLGFVTGLSPHGVGPWAEIPIYRAAGRLIKAQHYLAESCVRYFQRVYPGDSSALDPVLYKSDLLVPPVGYDEQYPLCRAASGLAQYLGTLELSAGQFNDLAFHLARSPEDGFACLGILLAATQSQGELPPSLRALVEAKRQALNNLRPALLTLRKSLGLPYDWVISIDEGLSEQAVMLASTERESGVLPLLFCEAENITLNEAGEIAQAIAWNRLDLAHDLAVSQGPLLETHPALQLQRLFIAIESGDDHLGEHVIKTFSANGHNTPAHSAQLNLLTARLRHRQRQNELAIEHLIKALNIAKNSPDLRFQILRLLSAITAETNPRRALELVDQSLELAPWSVDARLQRIELLTLLGETDSAQIETTRALNYAPNDRRLFSLI